MYDYIYLTYMYKNMLNSWIDASWIILNSFQQTFKMEIGWFEQNGFFFPFFSILIFVKTQSSANLCISFHSSLIVFDIFTYVFVSIFDSLCFSIS